MNDHECVELLQWALPKVGLRWRGFKNVRRQVCRRVAARMKELGLDTAGYRARLDTDPDELRRFDALCFVTISRFWRDRAVFDALRRRLLPELAEAARARGDRALRVWSAGCASGEEPHGIAIAWHVELAPRFPDLCLEIVATDFDPIVLERAERAAYEESSLREMPGELREAAFERKGDLYVLRPELRHGVAFVCADVRTWAPPAPLHLVLCRNLAFTYFDERTQLAFVERVADRLVPGGLLVIGAHESLPTQDRFELVNVPHVFRAKGS
mgnify:CR=1 FL=1